MHSTIFVINFVPVKQQQQIYTDNNKLTLTTKMDRKFLLPLFTLGFAISAGAATYAVKGNVSDAVTTDAIPGATYVIYAANDTIKPIISGLTDENGAFLTDIPNKGSYKAKFSFLGMKECWRDFNLTDITTAIDFGTVALSPDAELLDEIIVTGKRPIIEANGEKVVYNLEEDASSQTSTVLEMLRKVPMVTVDGQDNISVNGKSDFKIYVNGKPDPMLSGNASTVLKNMPASSIKKIEVITEPGAKYDAEGSGGILNIITVGKSSLDGYMVTIGTSISNKDAGANVYARTKVKNVTSSLSFNFSDSKIFDAPKSQINITRESDNSEDSHLLVQDAAATNKYRLGYGTFALSWEPDTTNLFTMSASLFDINNKQILTTLTNTYRADESLNYSNSQWMNAKMKWGSFTGNVSYQHNFNSPEHNIVASYQYAHGTYSNNVYQEYYDLYNYPITDLYSLQKTSNPTNEHTFQLDYTLPIRSFSTLETGAKAILRRNYGNGYTSSGDSFDTLQEQLNSNVNMEQYQNVGAIYASYSAHWKSWGAKAGLRYEYTHMGVKFTEGDYPDFATDLNDLVPNGAISYNFAPATSLRLAYQMRIRRPGVDELNPYSEEILAGYVRVGNPNLTSENTHNVSLTYSNFAGKLGGNIQATYSTCDNSINMISLLENDILKDTYANVGHERSFNINGFLSYRFSQKLNVSLNAGADFSRFKFAQEGLSNKGWHANAGINISYTMPGNVNLNFYGGGSTPSFDITSRNSGYKYYSISFSRDFLKNDRLKLTLYTSNFLASSMSYNNRSWGDGFYQTSHINTKAWQVGFAIKYTIGSMNSDVKHTANSIENNDVQNSHK